MQPIAAFAGIAMVILIGFSGSMLFEKTKIPDIIILIFLGFLFGPVARSTGAEFLPESMLSDIGPYFASMALMIILFDGGLNLNFDRVLSSIGISSFHSFFGFVFSVSSVTAIAYYIPDTPLTGSFTLALLLGCILGGVSSAVVIPIISRLSISEETKTTLILESVLTDVFCIVMVIALIEILREGDSIASWDTTKSALGNLAAAFSIAVVAGGIFGIIWLNVLKVFQGKPYSFMITIAALMIVYSIVEYVGGSGPMSALMFGLVLSNKDEFARMFKIKTEFVFEESVKQFHSELSFFIRTFFFVYLGLIFTEKAFYQDGEFQWLTLGFFMLMVTSLTAGLFIARFFVTELTVLLKKKVLKPDKRLIWTMLPRGLASAVLASLPIQSGVVSQEVSDYYINIAFLIILITTVLTTVGVFLTQRSKAGRARNGKTIPPPPVKQ